MYISLDVIIVTNFTQLFAIINDVFKSSHDSSYLTNMNDKN